jgi:hypothetical protein
VERIKEDFTFKLDPEVVKIFKENCALINIYFTQAIEEVIMNQYNHTLNKHANKKS